MNSRDKKIFKNVLREIVEHPNSRFLETKEYIQHGRVSVFIHGFFHPGIAMKNADKHFGLSKKEKDIIKHHMFPLTFPWPRSKEALLVCFVDKALSIKETLNR